MQIFFSLLKYIFLFVLLMIPGFLLGKKKRITDRGSETLTNLLTDIAMPFLVFAKLLQLDISSLRLSTVLCCLLLPLAVMLVVLFLSVLAFPKTGDPRRYPVNRFCSMMANCGFMGIPLSAAIFPHRPEVTLYVSVVNIISTYTLLTLGTYVLSGDKNEIQPKKLLLHPVLWAVVLGVIGTKLPAEISGFAEDYSIYLANLAAPLSMLVLGYRLSGLKLEGMVKNRGLYGVLCMKLLVMPFVTIGILLLVRLCGIYLDDAMTMALFLSTSVSTAGSAPALSQRFSLDSEHAAAVTIATTVCSVITLPLIYLLLDLLF